MPYGPYDDELEVKIPRHGKAPSRVPNEPSSMGMPAAKQAEASAGSINPPGVRDWYFFSLELQSALAAGVPFVRAISLVATDSPNRTIRRAGNIVLKQLQASSASRAIMQAGSIPPLIRQMLIVGLRGGDPAGVLRMVVDHYGWLLNIRGQILRVIAYPAMLVILGTAVMILRDVVMAVLAGTKSAGEAGIQASLFYALPILVAAVAAIVFAWVLYLPGIRIMYDRVVVTAPVVGKIIRQYTQAVFYRVLALLIEAGMPITDAWITASKVLPNEYLARRLEPGLRFLRDGESLDEALRQTRIMDAESRTMAAVGEVAGSTPALLRKYSAVTETALQSRVKMISSLLGLPCLAVIALGYFHSPMWLAALVFVLVFIRRVI